MPLMPKRVKFRKSQRGVVRGNASRGNTVSYGDYGVVIYRGKAPGAVVNPGRWEHRATASAIDRAAATRPDVALGIVGAADRA